LKKSIFTNAYSYRKRENKNNLENYLIEIFAYCLDIDIDLRTSFLALLNIKDSFENIDTQFSINASRPDIIINCKDSIIFIECKIEANESPGQLERYKNEIEKSGKANKIIVYLTKYYENKDCTTIRWKDISNLIKSRYNILSIEMNKFLNENNVIMETNFNPLDLVILKNIDSVIFKMAEALHSAKEFFEREVCPLQSNSPEIGLRTQKWFGYYKSQNTIIREVDIGFMWHFKNDENIYAAISFVITKFSHEIEIEKVRSETSDWKKDENETEIWFSKRKNLADILSSENQVQEIKTFFVDAITAFNKIRIQFPNHF